MTLADRIYNVGVKWGIHKPNEPYTIDQVCAQHDYIGFEWRELLEAVAKKDKEALSDAVGDVLVTAANMLIALGADMTQFEETLSVLSDFTEKTKDAELNALISFQLTYHKSKEDIRKGRNKENHIKDIYALCSLVLEFTEDWRADLEKVVSIIEQRTGEIVNGVFIKDSSAAHTD